MDGSAQNEVKFVSQAETFLKNFEFDGVTDKIDGYLYWENDSMFFKNEFYFEVQVGSFKTGINKRDQDMRTMVLETDKWPISSYKGTMVKYEKIDTTVTAYRYVSEGMFNLHGVEKKISVPGILIISDNKIEVQASFSVLLTEYKMEIPSILVAKVANEIHLGLIFYMNNAN